MLRALATRCNIATHGLDLGCNGTTLSLVAARSSAPQWLQPWKLHVVQFSSLPPHTDLKMPALSPTMSHGNIVSWAVKEGDEVTAGDALAEVETDKATLTWENQDDGIVAKILYPAGSKDVPVNTVVAVLCEEAADVGKFADYAPGGAAASSLAPAGAPAPSAAASSSGAHVEVSDRLGPAARLLMEGHHLSAQQIAPTGPRGIITKGDVLAAIEAGVKGTAAHTQPAQPAPAAPAPAAVASSAPAPKPAPAPQPSPSGSDTAAYTDIPNSQMRQIIARRLCESKQTIPHMYVSEDVVLERVNDARAALKEQGKKVSVNDFVVRAVALALAEVPEANAFFDDAQQLPAPFPGVDVCVAVATPGGLVTPIVKAADKLSLFEVSAAVRDLAGRARINKLKPEEFMGGSFTISNLGMFGVDKFFAIINPPQACIMAVGGAVNRVVLGADARPVSRPQMTVTLSADSRVYDADLCSRFLASFKRHMENPVTLFA